MDFIKAVGFRPWALGKNGTVRQPAGEDAGPTGRGFRFRSGELFNVQTHALGKRGNATRTNGGKALKTKGNGDTCPGHRRGKSGVASESHASRGGINSRYWLPPRRAEGPKAGIRQADF